LTILAQPVEVAPTGSTTFAPAQDGQGVQEGDVVRTGPGGLALLTFFDGSETQLADETQVEIEQAHSDPERRVVFFQAAGVTVNRVQRLTSGQVFQTDTPTAAGLVRGTTYVVTVSRLNPPVPTPTTSPPEPAPSEPPTGDPRLAEESSSEVPGEALNEDGGEPLPEASEASVEDSQDGAISEPSEDLGLVQQVAAGVGSPLPLNVPQASGPSSAVCTRDDVQSCVSSIVLLADPSGHVGRVDVAPRAPLPSISLVAAGDVGITAGKAAVQSSLTLPTLAQLQTTTRDLRAAEPSRQTKHEAEEMTHEGASWVAPDLAVPASAAAPDAAPVPVTPRLTGQKQRTEVPSGGTTTHEPDGTAPVANNPGSDESRQHDTKPEDKEQSVDGARPVAPSEPQTGQDTGPVATNADLIQDAATPTAAPLEGNTSTTEANQSAPDTLRNAVKLTVSEQPPVADQPPGASAIQNTPAQDSANLGQALSTPAAAPEQTNAPTIEPNPPAPEKPKDVVKPNRGYPPTADNGQPGAVPPGARPPHSDLPPDSGAPPDAPSKPEPPRPPNTVQAADPGKPVEVNQPKVSDNPQQVAQQPDNPLQPEKPQQVDTLRQPNKVDGADSIPVAPAVVSGADAPTPADTAQGVDQVPAVTVTDTAMADQKASDTQTGEQKAANTDKPRKVERAPEPINPPTIEMPAEIVTRPDSSKPNSSVIPPEVTSPTDGEKPKGAASIARDNSSSPKR
jgi:hypothetical protein